MQHKPIEEQLRELEALIANAQSVLIRFPFQTNIRQNISTLKDRLRELKKQLAGPTI
jgi:hypothetical protein